MKQYLSPRVLAEVLRASSSPVSVTLIAPAAWARAANWRETCTLHGMAVRVPSGARHV